MAHILIIDDSTTETYVLRKILESQGHKVSDACNGKEGINVAKIEQPDLIIMDVVMPELNGFQATRELTRNEATQNIPVAVYSSKDQAIDKMWAKKQGAVDYWVKPLTENELIESINHLLLDKGKDYGNTL